MVNITDTIKHAISLQSQLIREMKAAALECETVEYYLYVTADGTPITGAERNAEVPADWRLKKFSREKVTAHISPRHPQWQRYKAARRRASLLLTARLLLKLGEESVPNITAVRTALCSGRLNHHANSRGARSLSYAALRYLRKLKNRLQRAPEKFGVVEAWAAEMRERISSQAREGSDG